MDLARMLDKCRNGQWKIDDLDWSVSPRSFEREQEIAIVQYFTDMAGIERIAGDLFTEQASRAKDPALAAIFRTFVVDEIRHAECAERLARHYDVHKYQSYSMNPHLVAFAPAFRQALRHLSPEMANLYVTGGELLLDVALLRSIDDFVDDAMSRQVMDRINRDESRHIAMDFFMTEEYALGRGSVLMHEQHPSLRRRAGAVAAFAVALYHLRPFAQAVFLEPMAVVDPSKARLDEAWKRIQLLIGRPEVKKRPLPRVIHGVQKVSSMPIVGRAFGSALGRLAGLPDAMWEQRVTDLECAAAAKQGIEELAQAAA